MLVVGAGPAGCTVGRYAASFGLDVVILERKKEIGRMVHCGEMMVETSEIKRIFPSVDNLEELLTIDEKTIERRFQEIVIHGPRGKGFTIPLAGFTINRARYERNLLKAAEREGCLVQLGTNVESIRRHAVVANQREIEGRVIVGADGPLSTVARKTPLPINKRMAIAMRTIVNAELVDKPHLHFGSIAPGGYGWVFPKRGKSNVGLGVSHRHRKDVNSLLKRFAGMRGFRCEEVVGGYVPVNGPIRRTVWRNVILVGDAAGQVLPTNGGGIQTAMICARIAANCIRHYLSRGYGLESYEHLWREDVGRPLRTGRRIKSLASLFWWSDSLLSLSMSLMGVPRMGRAIRCEPLL